VDVIPPWWNTNTDWSIGGVRRDQVLGSKPVVLFNSRRDGLVVWNYSSWSDSVDGIDGRSSVREGMSCGFHFDRGLWKWRPDRIFRREPANGRFGQ